MLHELKRIQLSSTVHNKQFSKISKIILNAFLHSYVSIYEYLHCLLQQYLIHPNLATSILITQKHGQYCLKTESNEYKTLNIYYVQSVTSFNILISIEFICKTILSIAIFRFLDLNLGQQFVFKRSTHTKTYTILIKS